MTFSGGLRGLRPPATFWQPFRLLEVSQLYECLCEPYVRVGLIGGAAKAATEVSKQGSLDTSDLSPLRGSITRDDLTQGSQSLALGLTLIAAPQL